MKIQTDFITNSSSSAFVVIGVEIENSITDDEIYDLLNDNKLTYFSKENVIGKIIASLDDGGIEIAMTFKDMQNAFEDVESTLKKLSIYEKVKLIAGVFST